jgi:hypothetical protein
MLKCCHKFVSGVLVLVLSTSAIASENDVFSGRYHLLPKLDDASDEVNKIVLHYVELGVEKANRIGRENERTKMRTIVESLRDFLGRHFRWQIAGANLKISKIDTWGRLITNADLFSENNAYRTIKYEAPIDRAKICVEDSVYRDFNIGDSKSLKLASKFHDTMAVLLNIENLLIGTDKFSHFFNRGVKYFKRRYGIQWTQELTDEEREEYTMDAGEHSENSAYGVKSTGIASYADLMANFQGMRFWNDLLGVGKDVVTKQEVKNPMVQLKDFLILPTWYQSRRFEERRLLSDLSPAKIVELKKQGWVKTKFWTVAHHEFDIRKYVNVAWDEAYNCSKFLNEKMAKSTQQRVNEISVAVSRDLLENALTRETCNNISGGLSNKKGNFETVPAVFKGEPQMYNCPINLEAVRRLKAEFGDYYPALVNEIGYTFFKQGDLPDGGFLKTLLFGQEPSPAEWKKNRL